MKYKKGMILELNHIFDYSNAVIIGFDSMDNKKIGVFKMDDFKIDMVQSFGIIIACLLVGAELYGSTFLISFFMIILGGFAIFYILSLTK